MANKPYSESKELADFNRHMSYHEKKSEYYAKLGLKEEYRANKMTGGY
jgi:hypothetical protein